jgi:hypothetical protein
MPAFGGAQSMRAACGAQALFVLYILICIGKENSGSAGICHWHVPVIGTRYYLQIPRGSRRFIYSQVKLPAAYSTDSQGVTIPGVGFDRDSSNSSSLCVLEVLEIYTKTPG